METAREKTQPVRSVLIPSLSLWGGAVVKRLFDVIVAALGLVLLAPVLCLLSVLIKRESPGPAFYRGPRLGKGGKPFGILKFRTMYDRPASYRGPRITAQGDPRVTPLGHWLRETKLNELPQLWNVLVGEMSLVGPRPEDPEIARSWPAKARSEILSVKPGITSPASIVYRDEESLLPSGASRLMDDYFQVIMPDKLRLDQLYVRNHTFLSDLDVIFWTLVVLLPALRTQPIPLESVFNGWFYRFSRRYASWFVADNLAAFAAVGVAGALWRMGGPLDIGLPQALARAAGIALLFSLVNSWMGLGRVIWRSARPSLVFKLAFSSAVSTLLVALVDWALPEVHPIPLGMVIVAGLLAFLGFVAVRYRERLVTGFATQWLGRRTNKSSVGERVLVVGAGECALLAILLLRRSRLSSAFSVVGMVDDDMHKTGMTVDGHTVFGLTRRIPEIVQEQDVGVILYAIETIQPDEQRRILDLCHQTPARVVLIPDLLSFFRERMTATD
jgi:lipopolysaccharide/colanic/teichoic acid biosynthesis glycosyltransferase